jgi:hypothetical protein
MGFCYLLIEIEEVEEEGGGEEGGGEVDYSYKYAVRRLRLLDVS